MTNKHVALYRPQKVRPQHWELQALRFQNSAWVLVRPAELWTMKSDEMGATVYRLYPRRLESYYKGSIFYSDT